MKFQSWIAALLIVGIGLLMQTGCGSASAKLPMTATEIDPANDPANMEVPAP